MSPWEPPADAGLTIAISDANEHHQAGHLINELEALAEAQDHLDAWRAGVVHQARDKYSPNHRQYTWQTIGSALGITKQAAQQRYGHKNHWTAADTTAGLTPSMLAKP